MRKLDEEIKILHSELNICGKVWKRMDGWIHIEKRCNNTRTPVVLHSVKKKLINEELNNII